MKWATWLSTFGLTPQCAQCGNRGCLEALASGTAIAKIAREKGAEPGQKDGLLGELEPGLITAERVLDAAGRRGTPWHGAYWRT